MDSIGLCFVCLIPVATQFSAPIKSEPGYPGSHLISPGRSYSLQRLSHYLDMDMKTMFPSEQLIPPPELAMLGKSKLKVQLCEECAHLVKKFSRLHQQMERIQMEITSSLGLIRERFLEVDKIVKTENGGCDSDMVEEMNILNSLRKEVTTKCSLKLLNIQPRVKLKNLGTQKAISGQLQCGGLSSTSTLQQPCTLPNFNDEDPAVPLIDIGIVKVEPHLQELGNPVSDSETLSNVSNHSRSKRQNARLSGSCHACALCGKEFSNREYLKKHHLQVHTSPKFRCEKCNKMFKRKSTLIYHQGMGKDCVALRIIELSREGKFRCEVCNNRFADSGKLARHSRSVHLKIKEHRCNLCKREFARKDCLQAHMRNKHKFR